jgi:hypothetical protein
MIKSSEPIYRRIQAAQLALGVGENTAHGSNAGTGALKPSDVAHEAMTAEAVKVKGVVLADA